VERFLVMRFQLVLVLALKLVLVQVKVNSDFLVLLKLHDNERISRLTLTQGRVQTHDKHVVHLVRLWKYHELLDGLVLNLVVVGFASESERGFVHVDIETTSIDNVLACTQKRQKTGHTWA
jgi:hypothetical protein